MNRTIKYRGVTDDNCKDIVYGSYVFTKIKYQYGETSFDSTTHIRHEIHTEDGRCYNVIPETVGQFTSKIDIKRKEIYEGDIIICNTSYDGGSLPHRGTVVYNKEFCAFGTLNDGGVTLFHNHMLNTFEIIGNIYNETEGK